jgi:hypothetical protein
MDKRLATLFVLALALAGCRSRPPQPPAPPPPVAEETPEPPEVKKVQEEIVVAAWAEPARLPNGGGQAQILVRVQKRGGAPFPGVEVSLRASAGTLYSGGKVLLTDRGGMTRDRLTTRQTARVTLNAGGTRYSFRVTVGGQAAPAR